MAQAQVFFGKPNSRNKEHVANVCVRFGNGDYVRGLMIYRKPDGSYNLRYPSYRNKNGNEKPYFKFGRAREMNLVKMFLDAEKSGRFVEHYPLSSEETLVFSKVQ